MTYEWVETVNEMSAAEMSDYVYAPDYPPKSKWKSLLFKWVKETRDAPDSAKPHITITKLT